MSVTTVGVKLDDQTRARLKKLAEARQRSPHWLMKDAINRYLDAEEQYQYEMQEDEARWQQYLDTGTHLTHEEVTSWLDELADRARKAETG